MEPERQQRLTTEERSNLVAYLDGELTGEESQALAAKLDRNPVARRESESLQRTWQLLDLLEKPRASAEFTTRTLTILGEASSLDDRLVRFASRLANQSVRWILLGLAGALLFVVGFAATRWVPPDRTARLARELSIAEHLDEYRAAGSFEFLKQLDESPEIHQLADPSPR